MLLETHTDHPRHVAYNVTPCGQYAVKTVLLISGHSFETTVFEISGFETLYKCNTVYRASAVATNQIFLDKYTFMQWTG